MTTPGTAPKASELARLTAAFLADAPPDPPAVARALNPGLTHDLPAAC